jgi:hypothetical protein
LRQSIILLSVGECEAAQTSSALAPSERAQPLYIHPNYPVNIFLQDSGKRFERAVLPAICREFPLLLDQHGRLTIFA